MPLFIVGLILVIMTFPVAWSVSAGLGYALGIAAIVLGAYLVSRRGGKTLPLILGTVLIVLAVIAITGTAVIHVGLWSVSTALQSATKVKHVEGRVKELIRAGSLGIAVLNVSEGKYVAYSGSFYAARKGYKVVIMTLMIKNEGSKPASLASVWDFKLITSSGRCYSEVLPIDLNLIPPWKLNSTVKSEALSFNQLSTSGELIPNTYVEGDVMFQIPIASVPAKLYLRVGVIGGYAVTVRLK